MSLLISKIFIKYNVEVIYSSSNEPSFRNKLALEAFYGMFGQMEGENIQTRTNEGVKTPTLVANKKIQLISGIIQLSSLSLQTFIMSET
jgi:hypothetical protein